MKDSDPVSLPCPYCGLDINKTFGWFVNVKCICPYCNEPFKMKQVSRGIPGIEEPKTHIPKGYNFSF